MPEFDANHEAACFTPTTSRLEAGILVTMSTLNPTRLSLLLFLLIGCVSTQTADLVLRGGRVFTVDDEQPEAEAVAVRGGRILAVGNNEQIAAFVGEHTRVVDLDGRLAIPGFIDGHAHFTGIGSMRLGLDLTKVANWDEVIELVRVAVSNAEPGEWIIGRGWHQEKWDHIPSTAVEGFPTHATLSEISKDNPVCLAHASGHACFFNAKAMELAGVDRHTEAPAGGDILHDETGEPCGIFRETAQRLVARAYEKRQAERTPAERKNDLKRIIRLADAECSSKGVTSFQDAGSNFATIEVFEELARAGELQTRLWVMVRDSNANLAATLGSKVQVGSFDDHLTVRAVKRTLDGALGSRGAWLLDPYSDSPESTGLATSSVESVMETARIAAAHDCQLCVHAIGDRANREVLDIIEAVVGDKQDHRWRIEHAQHVAEEDIQRFANLGVIASMQSVHCTSDGPFVVQRLGHERAEEGAYVWRKFIDAGVTVTNGTDAPVEDVDPIACYHSAVSRLMNSGERFFPSQRMTREEALRSYTINCARAAFEEDIKGSLTPGKLADIVVLSKDILRAPENEILDARVDFTIIGGEIVYERAR